MGGTSNSSPSTMVSKPTASIVGFGLVIVSVSTVDSRETCTSAVVVAGGSAVTVTFEVAGLEVDAVRLNVDRGDGGFVDVCAKAERVALLCCACDVRKPKRLVIDGAVVDEAGVVVGVGVGFTGDTDLDDPFDSREVRVDREDRGKE